MGSNLQIIAHRGWSARAPENTLAALTHALDLSVDGLELDVQMTRDGHVVVCHDEKLDRTTNGTGLLADHTLEELQALDAGGWFSPEFRGERIPTLAQVLKLITDSKWRGLVNVELKTGIIPYPGIEAAVVQLLDEYEVMEHTVISSFNHYSLVEVRRVSSQAKTGILYIAGLFEPWEYASKIGCSALHPMHLGAAKPIVDGARAAGLTVNAWTVNEPSDIERVIAAGVDGVITDHPDQIKRRLETTTNL